MKKVARNCAVDLLHAADRKRHWTPYEKQQWTKAFNALQRLAGKKIVYLGGKLTKDG